MNTQNTHKNKDFIIEIREKLDSSFSLRTPYNEFETTGVFKFPSSKRRIERRIANLIYNLEKFIKNRAYAYDNYRGSLRPHTDTNYEVDYIALSQVYNELFTSLNRFHLSFKDNYFKVSNFIRDEIFNKLDQKGNRYHDDSYLTIDKIFRNYLNSDKVYAYI